MFVPSHRIDGVPNIFVLKGFKNLRLEWLAKRGRFGIPRDAARRLSNLGSTYRYMFIAMVILVTLNIP